DHVEGRTPAPIRNLGRSQFFKDRSKCFEIDFLSKLVQRSHCFTGTIPSVEVGEESSYFLAAATFLAHGWNLAGINENRGVFRGALDSNPYPPIEAAL